MGKIRTKTVKRAARQVVEKYFGRLSHDYYVNKRVVVDVTLSCSKKLKNKISGYATHIVKRLAKGPVRGISLKMQEEERERRMDYIPEVSWIEQKVHDGITVDPSTMKMLKKLETGVPKFVRLEKEERVSKDQPRNRRGGDRRTGERRERRDGDKQERK